MENRPMPVRVVVDSKASSRAVSRYRKPEEMTLEAWQVALRRQYAETQNYSFKDVGAGGLFSDFEVHNPETKRTYRVAIRGEGLGVNYCSCPDFAVNTLGTCKHVEFMLQKARKRPGAAAALRRGFEPAHTEIYLRYGAKREVMFRAGRATPPAVCDMARRLVDPQGRLRPEAYARFPEFLKRAQATEPELRCYPDALEFIGQVRDRAEALRRVDALLPGGAEDPALDSLLRVKLYPYQKQGACFAARAGRCLIADDMGLGKTVQAIAAAEILVRAMGIERVLIVCPTSLKHQWRNEVDKFTGRSALVVEGLLMERSAQYDADALFKIANYDVLHRDVAMIRRWGPELIILDEAQRIKNWKTRAARSVKQLDCDYAFVLTGTPLENRLDELHSIVEFVDRFHLGPLFRFLSEHQHVDDHGRVVGYRNLSGISRSLAPVLLRRTKREVLTELPERMEKRFFVPMTAQQQACHDENRDIVARIVHKWRRYGFLSEGDQRRMTCALQNMRMACNSTYLLDGQTDHGHKADELAATLEEILEERDAKVVIFSQWLRMHELIARRLARRNWDHVLFHGGVPGPRRKDLIRRFQETRSCRLFLSTDAGGVGLNLQNASAVINADLPWNPAVLEQRIGRVHRLGQHRPVRVVNFIARGTIEEGMLGLLSFKQSMFAGVLDGGQDEVFLGGTRLKRFMESVEKATGANGTGVERARPVSSARAPAPAAGAPDAASGAARQQQAVADLLTAGAAFLDQLGQALRATPQAAPGGARAAAGGLIGVDERTGQPCLKIPLPSPELVQQLAGALSALIQKR
jgi:superfamily II DNA or RNA helicase